MTKLHIYRAESGQWAGIVFEDGEETARIAGCASQDEVVQTAYDCHFALDEIEYADKDAPSAT